MLTNTEKALLKVALKYKKADDDANPDVGMGPSVGTLLERVIEEANDMVITPISMSDRQRAEILAWMKATP